MSPAEWTWTCHICGRERPDARISVFKIDLSSEYGLPNGTMQQNVRYCNDHPDCIEKAKTFRLPRRPGGERDRAWNLVRKDPGDVSGKSTPKALSAFEEAEKQLYVADDKTFYHPGIAFWRALFVGMAGKQVGGMAVSTAVSIAVAHVEDEFTLLDPETLGSKKPKPLTAKRWVLDQRPVYNEHAKARIIASRPKWTQWGGILTLEVDLDVFRVINVLTKLHNIAGRYGVGAGRIRKHANTWGGLGLGKYRVELFSGD